MNSKIKNYIVTFLFAIIIYTLSALLFLLPPQKESLSERRALQQFPELNAKTLLNGSFMTTFEDFTLDQFPARDTFRKIKTFTALNLFKNSTVNDLYLYNNTIVKQEYPLRQDVVFENLNSLYTIWDTYIKDNNHRLFVSLVPDKNYYFAPLSSHLAFDYEGVENDIKAKFASAEYIDIKDTLSHESYYKTDTHWSQDKIVSTAKLIAEKLGVEIPELYEEKVASEEFYGVYTGQFLLKTPSDKIIYLTNDVIDNFSVKVLDMMGKYQESTTYNFDKINSDKVKDKYDFFLSGATPIVTIENPNSTSERELIMLRDSFSSSLAPLLAQGYAKTTLVDVRYISPTFIEAFVDFENADVVFMYCPLVLNSPSTIRVE